MEDLFARREQLVQGLRKEITSLQGKLQHGDVTNAIAITNTIEKKLSQLVTYLDDYQMQILNVVLSWVDSKKILSSTGSIANIFDT
jgi:hypothetical protein